MFYEKNTSGKHMICDFKEIANIELLNDCFSLKNMLFDICEKHNFQVLNIVSHNFEPIGCSILILLSESHISIHTFPEKLYLAFDIYTCREYSNNDCYNEIYDNIKKLLQASNESECKIIDRYF